MQVVVEGRLILILDDARLVDLLMASMCGACVLRALAKLVLSGLNAVLRLGMAG